MATRKIFAKFRYKAIREAILQMGGEKIELEGKLAVAEAFHVGSINISTHYNGSILEIYGTEKAIAKARTRLERLTGETLTFLSK